MMAVRGTVKMNKKPLGTKVPAKLGLEKKTLRRLVLDERALQQVAGGSFSRGRTTTSNSVI